MRFKTFKEVENWEEELENIMDKREGKCKCCGRDFDRCVGSRGSVVHTPTMKETDWECLKCHDRGLFEFEENLRKLCEKEGLFLKCDKCGNPMRIITSGVCGEWGEER